MSAPYQPKHVYGIQPSPHDPRDFHLVSIEAPITGLPTAAMLPTTPPVRDQGQEGSCWGFSGSAAHEAKLLQKGDSTVLSPAFLYWKTREAMGDDSVDGGSDIRTGLDTLLKAGNCAEAHMPYVAGHFADPPLQAAIDDAANRRISVYARLTDATHIKYAITQALPVVFGIPVFQAFETSRDGHVPLPAAGDQLLGGHAILCIGYSDVSGVPGGGYFVLQNSWGVGAGDKGRYYIPYDYLFNNPAASWAEAWSLDI